MVLCHGRWRTGGTGGPRRTSTVLQRWATRDARRGTAARKPGSEIRCDRPEDGVLQAPAADLAATAHTSTPACSSRDGGARLFCGVDRLVVLRAETRKIELSLTILANGLLMSLCLLPGNRNTAQTNRIQDSGKSTIFRFDASIFSVAESIEMKYPDC